eukprot:TRINITY_DN74182_c0_g1_i1.p1 TRINITY_DN74182_c0_g1~~TRINITY_DN74182_c0_g1_i1.p1  ORF type:complete len:462 (+),score=71.23 TRINITY_DN74182_c0_g1_i1:66-1451(+)
MASLRAGAAAAVAALNAVRWQRSARLPDRCDDKQPAVDGGIVVVGGGVMGLSAAWSLSRGGHRVTLIDAEHSLRGSWGESRIARVSYADSLYVRLARRSYELYDELAKKSDRPIMYKTGCLDISTKGNANSSALAKTYKLLGQEHEVLTRAEVARRWPALRLPETYTEDSVFCPEGDAVQADVVLEELSARLEAPEVENATLIHEAVAHIDRKRKTIVTEAGTEVCYTKLVLATGIWTNALLQVMDLPLLPLVVSVEQTMNFLCAPGTEDMHSVSGMPVIVEGQAPPKPDMKRSGFYIVPHMPGGVDGFKIGLHRQGALLDTPEFPILKGSREACAEYFTAAAARGDDTWRDTWPDEEDAHVKSAIKAFLSETMPNVLGDRACALYCRCPYDCHLYADEDFIVGVHPLDADLIVMCGFAGEGFKFGPAIGEFAACLALGKEPCIPEAVERLRIGRKSYLDK